MGKSAGILLVAGRLFLLVCCLLPGLALSDGRVSVEDYQAFWLWSGVDPQPVLDEADRVYLFQGERLVRDGMAQSHMRGPSPRLIEGPDIWLVYRSETLSWDEADVAAIRQRIRRWEGAGTTVQGLQIDFDARSHALREYATFLRWLRGELPEDYKLGITGLMDWATSGSVSVLNDLDVTLDEMVIQTYQAVTTVENYADYLPALQRLKLPFRIGLIQYGHWDQAWERRLRDNPSYQGEVVFLLNQDPSKPNHKDIHFPNR